MRFLGLSCDAKKLPPQLFRLNGNVWDYPDSPRPPARRLLLKILLQPFSQTQKIPSFKGSFKQKGNFQGSLPRTGCQDGERSEPQNRAHAGVSLSRQPPAKTTGEWVDGFLAFAGRSFWALFGEQAEGTRTTFSGRNRERGGGL